MGVEMCIRDRRSPTVLEFANEGAVDHGRHVSEFAVTTCPGAPEAADPVFAGLRYNLSLIHIRCV